MKINFNMSAIIANDNLARNDKIMAESIERLSSGFKINHAKDSPSGIAIAKRMHAQIRGLSQATQNASDGISIIETAEGALTEVHDMLQRINELAIKSANGTLSDNDRELIESEVNQLKDEINRISETTQFNGSTLLDGTFDLKGYSENLNVEITSYSDEAKKGYYKLEVSREGAMSDNEKIVTSVDEQASTGPLGYYKVKLVREKKTDGSWDYYANLIDEGEVNALSTGMNVSLKGLKDNNLGTDVTESTHGTGGSNDSLEFKDSLGNVLLSMVVDWSEVSEENSEVIVGLTGNVKVIDGNQDALTDSGKKVELIDVKNTKSIMEDNGHTYTIKGQDEFELKIDVDWDNLVLDKANAAGKKVSTDFIIDLTGIGAMTMQIGANEGQVLDIRIPEVSTKSLGLNETSVLTKVGARGTISKVSDAINLLSGIRARLGAYQNRLEHTVSSLDITNENMTSAYSRIMDTDMAQEMTEYTKNQVLTQAGTSMLAQANERPSQVLQLLQ